jgi:hypothetical protein
MGTTSDLVRRALSCHLGVEKKPRSDGSRVYFGYEGKALVVSGPELLLEDQRSF